MTFRMRGHEESSGTKYIPQELFEQWEKRDPLINYENYLLNSKVITENQIKTIRNDYSNKIDNAIDIAFDEKPIVANTEKEINDVYFTSTQIEFKPENEVSKELRFIEAISEALYQNLERDESIIMMGQDIAEYGGVFKVTQGFLEKFGADRIRNTPLCESAIIGAALGLSLKGYKAIVEMQFADFVSCGFNQIVNNLAKLHYRWGQNADVIIRMPSGAGVGAGPFHSQSNESWFFHTPGLKIVYPSNPYDAKGLMTSAILEKNPVLFFEHKALYRKIKGLVPDNLYTVEIGKAKLIKEGKSATIISYGHGVVWAMNTLEESKYDCDLIDLRTLLPYDKETIYESVKKTGKVIILHEDTLTGGIGAEISADITQNLFEYLDAPVIRVASLDTPVPFADELEKNFLPADRFKVELKKLVVY